MRIVLVHAAALGDTVLLIPLLRALRRSFGGARLELVSRPEFGQLLAAMGLIEGYHRADAAVHARWFAEPVAEEASAAPEWAGCDVLLSAVSSGADAWAGHAARHVRAGRVVYFEPRPGEGYLRHVTEFHREQLAAAGLDLAAAEAVARRWNPDGPVVIHPGAGSLRKCWPLGCFVEVARGLVRRGLAPVLVVGEAEVERVAAGEIRALAAEFSTRIGPTLGELADLLRGARGYVGNDAGPTHLAAALGVGTVALFGVSDPVVWRPVGGADGVRVLRGPEPGAVDGRWGLDPERVVEAVLEMVTFRGV